MVYRVIGDAYACVFFDEIREALMGGFFAGFGLFFQQLSINRNPEYGNILEIHSRVLAASRIQERKADASRTS